MSATLEEKRDRFKEHIRPIIRKQWDTACRSGWDGSFIGLQLYREILLAIMKPILPLLMLSCGYDNADALKAASDAESVITELFDEIATSESMN